MCPVKGIGKEFEHSEQSFSFVSSSKLESVVCERERGRVRVLTASISAVISDSVS